MFSHNEMRAVLDKKDANTLKESAGLADEVVLTRRVEFTLEGSCPESNWEDQENLEFEKGMGIESLEEADVPFECVQDVDAHGTEPSNETQEMSEVSDLVEKECSPFGSDGLGSVKKGLTLVLVGSENSQLFVFEGVFKVSEEIKDGDVDIIIEGKGKSVVPKLTKENLKSGLMSEAVTRLKEQWLVNKVPADQLQFDLECKDTTLANVIQGCAVKRQNLKCCLDKEGSLANVNLKTNRMKGPEDKTNELLKKKELCGSSEDGLSLKNIVDKITPMKGVCESLFHTGEQANHLRVKWKRGEG
ncbi:S-methyl-5'-thioadenosine phosphorylase isoform X1 [Hypanus sabinus]|uniref:S-methyl-5'-thioadenosine phosphorylase isoform X1 n=1 Tax=Hypanus sabinus TaxID=79690 RepID=UPI0028C3DAD8|nr:S-methyl-5'-thioadenosine phosphorylase isoform X1 [Hypanus sabinus]